MAALNPSRREVDNPYVGPRTFEEKDGRFFFGREREARELLSLVISEPLVLFYAESGAGKSSLINTRLVPGLRQEGFEVLPIGRVSGELPAGITEVGNIFIYNLLLSLDRSQKQAEQLTHTTLADYVQSSLAETEMPDDDAEAVPARVLIIDQFEEIVTAHLARWSEREQFFRQLRRAMKANPLLWVVLTLREDYIAALDPYARLLPGKLRARFHMQRMGYRAAQQAIEQPAQAAGRPFAPGVASTLVDNLRQLQTTAEQTGIQLGQFVEPVQLQVVCYQLWKNLTYRPLAEISQLHLREFGQVDTALVDFYEQAIRQASEQSGVSEMALRTWFDRTLTAGSQPDAVVDERANDRAESLAPALQSLVDQYLLRGKGEAGQTRYTLVDQRFYPAILRANWTWWLRQEQSTARITQNDVDELGDVDTALAQFYQQAIARVLVQTDESEIELRNWFEKQLITEAGTRGTVYQGPEQTGGLANRTVQHLANQFILRAEIRAGGTWYELVHDRFIEPILQANQSWRARQSDLVQAALGWQEAGHPEDNLYRGQRLKTALTRVSVQNVEPLVAEFLAASEKLNKELEEKEAFRQRELEQTQAQARAAVERAQEQARAAKRLRRLVIALALVFLLAIGAAVVAWVQQRRAQTQEQLARDRAAEAVAAQQTAEAETLARATAQAQAETRRIEAETERTRAQARALAAAAITKLTTDPELSLLLAIQAVLTTYAVDTTVTGQAEQALYQALQSSRVRQTFGDHTGQVWRVAFDPAGTRLATAGSDGRVNVWDMASGQALLTLDDQQGKTVYGLAFSPDGTRLVTTGENRTATIWDAESGQGLASLTGHTGTVWQAAFSPDGSRLATAGGDGTAIIWDAVSGRELLTLTGHTGEVVDIVFSPDGTRLATASHDHTAKVWDAASGQVLATLTGHTNDLWAVAFNADGSRLATASRDQTAKIWDLTSGQDEPALLTLSGQTNEVADVIFSPDGRLITANADGTAQVWNAATGQPLFTLAGHTGGIRAMAVNADGTRLATASQDGTARVWDIAGHSDVVNHLVFSPDGHLLATASQDGTAKVWAFEPGGAGHAAAARPLLTLTGHTAFVRRVAFSPDGHRLATASGDGTAKMWQLNRAADGTLSAQEVVTLRGHTAAVQMATFSPDGRRLATASLDGTARVWSVDPADAAFGQELLSLAGHKTWVTAVVFSPAGSQLATASYDQTARVWDAKSGQERLTLAQPAPLISLAFDHSGRRLATTSSEGTASVWDVETGQRLAQLVGHTNSVRDVVFSPDDTRLATASYDNTARLWAADSGRLELTLDNNTPVNSVAFSPDGTYLATANNDGTLHLYLLDNIAGLLDQAKTRLTRRLTPEECRAYLLPAGCETSP